MCPGSLADPTERSALIKARAKELGFDLCGIARAEAIDDGGLSAWIEHGYAADMGYMKERLDERLDPRRVLPGARSVVVVASSYWRPGDETRPELRRVARYARGRDYHLFLRRKVRKLRRRLLELCPGARAHPTVDTSPVMEKVWSRRRTSSCRVVARPRRRCTSAEPCAAGPNVRWCGCWRLNLLAPSR